MSYSSEPLEDSLKIKEWEMGMLQNEVAASQGITIRRRRPTGPPLHYVGPFEFQLQNEGNTPRNHLEEIIWHKDTEVTQMKEKMPLSVLKKALENAPATRDFIGFLRAAYERTRLPGLIAKVKKASPSRGVLREDFDPGNSINNCAIPSTDMLASTAMEAMEDTGTNVLNAEDDRYGGVTVYLDERMDPTVLASLLQSSMSNWRDQGKNSVWIKLPKAHINLLGTVWKAGFRYHHDQRDYWMFVHQIPNPADTLAANASHHVGTGAFVIKDKREVLVVKERDGWFKSTGVYKLPTGTVGVGEDISAAAIRQVKEQTGIEAEFVRVLTLRQSHKSFPQRSDLFVVCMLRPLSSDILMQDSECAAVQWMPVEEYAAQPLVQLTSSLDSVAKICLEKLVGNCNCNCLTPLPSLACNCKGFECETFMDRLGCSS